MELLHNWRTFQSSFPWQGWRQQREGDRESRRAEVPLQKLVNVMLSLHVWEPHCWSWLAVVGLIKTGLILFQMLWRPRKTLQFVQSVTWSWRPEPEQNCIFFSEVGACIFCLPVLLMQALTKPENYFAHGYFYQQFMLCLSLSEIISPNVGSAKILFIFSPEGNYSVKPVQYFASSYQAMT